ncbi:hypothetical protein L873DRAFT_1664434, partial [Choiromyces venosus 120613-1]
GCTPLHLSGIKDHESIIRLLLAVKPVDPSLEDHDNKTPLHLEAWNEQDEVVRIFLSDKSHDVRAPPNGG